MLRIHAAVQTHIFICNNRDSDMPNCTHIHTHTRAQLAQILSFLQMFSIQESHLHSGDGGELKKNSNNKKWCGAVSHSLMTSPQSYAALIFPLLHVHHTHTQWDTHRERERHCPPHLRPLLLLLLQPTHTTWGMYREDTTLHITHLHKPNLELGPCAHTNLGKCIFVNRKELRRYSTELKITIHLLSH